ncbi:hypothetical protein BH23CHL2_BH23CHL2_14710 [soil metagenome]
MAEPNAGDRDDLDIRPLNALQKAAQVALRVRPIDHLLPEV